ncbi:hypothetical protein ABZ419_02300 [Streptomyces cinnamoneus]|uniref:hypothetical protein n=1 Tax=Streptomyces cinnamoneus TaxID=53446 RepID=UPI0033FFDF98
MPKHCLKFPVDRPGNQMIIANPGATAGIIGWPPGGAATVLMSRHHIIAGSRLKFFWNWLMEHQKTLSDPLVAAVGNQVANYPHWAYWAQAGHGPQGDFMNLVANWDRYVHDDAYPSPTGFDLLYEVIYWMPANIFLGPRVPPRLRDPDNDFEVDSRWVVIDPPRSQQQFDARQEASNIIDAFNSALGPYPTLRQARRAVQLLRQTVTRHQPWPWTPTAWSYGQNPTPPPATPGVWINFHAPAPQLWRTGEEGDETEVLVPGQPAAMGHIVIDGKTISLEIIDSDDEAGELTERGTVQGVSLAGVLAWGKPFGAAVPEALAQVQAESLVVEVATRPGRQIAVLAVASTITLADIQVRAVLRFTCIKVKVGASPAYGFLLKILVCLPVYVDGKATEIWLGGDVIKSTKGHWSLNVSSGTYGSGLSVLDIAKALGAEVDPEVADLIPALTRVALFYGFGDRSLSASFTVGDGEVVFASLPS